MTSRIEEIRNKSIDRTALPLWADIAYLLSTIDRLRAENAALHEDYDLIFKENQRLAKEVVALKAVAETAKSYLRYETEAEQKLRDAVDKLKPDYIGAIKKKVDDQVSRKKCD